MNTRTWAFCPACQRWFDCEPRFAPVDAPPVCPGCERASALPVGRVPGRRVPVAPQPPEMPGYYLG
jgi:hypothetical protein